MLQSRNVLPLCVVATAVAGGFFCARAIAPGTAWWDRAAMGVVLGLTLLGFFGFLLASLFGLTPTVVVVSAGVVGGVSFGLARRSLVPSLRGARRHEAASPAERRALRVPAAYALAFLALFCAFFPRAVYLRGGAISTGEWNNIGDLGLHVGIVQGFVKGENFPPEHPDFAGARLTYPFLCDFVAAMLVVSGLELTRAFLWQNLLLAMALLGILCRWALTLTRDRGVAFLLPVLLFFNGGLGFHTLITESRQSGISLLRLFAHPPHSVTILGEDAVIRWGNSLTSLFLTQRTWLMGLPLVLIVWTQCWQSATTADPATRRRLRIAAGLVAGLLPFTHVYSFLVVMGVTTVWAVMARRAWRDWLGFFAAALLVALPQLLWILGDGGVRAGGFVGWRYGWTKPEGTSLVVFWLANLGLTLPLAFMALAWRGREPLLSRRLVLHLLPWFACFVAGNLVRLAPWEWDTNKVLFYGYLGLLLPVAVLLSRLFAGSPATRAAAAGCVLILTLSGGLDVWRVLSRAQEWNEFEADAGAQARLIEAHTPPRARVLSSFLMGRAVLLTGRRSLVGHPWTMESHGIPASRRLMDMTAVFAGTNDAERLLREYRIDYVLVGPAERREPGVNEVFFTRFPKVGEAGGAVLYRIPRE